MAAITDLVVPLWVQDQRDFFARATTRDNHKISSRERWAMALLFAGMAAGALVTVSPFFVAAPYLANWDHGLIVLMGLTPAIAAAMSGYAESMAFASQAKRYRWMAELFMRAELRLREAIGAGHTANAQQLILELGNEALEEDGDWVLVHRERPPEAPKGG